LGFWERYALCLVADTYTKKLLRVSDVMTPADRYRALAAHLRSRAMQEHSPALRAQWAHLAQCYVRLAGQADQNSRTDIVYEFDPSARGRNGGEAE
jgi:hypothetical protein